MIQTLLFALTLAAALGCGLVAGASFAFSSFVMRAFDRLPPAQGIAAMQSINPAVVRPAFLSVFVGTALACAVLGGRRAAAMAPAGQPVAIGRRPARPRRHRSRWRRFDRSRRAIG